ncbi:MAG: ABC transporter permease, partial [Candidatus Rokubacteria bacterium]|nr:ABC transporter permease [Candidatus Rokubacteria bacterium]
TFFMMLGVLIGIAAVTIIVSIGEGAKAQVAEKIRRLGGFGTVMVVAGGGATRGVGGVDSVPATLTVQDGEAIRVEIPKVRDVALVQVKSNVAIKAGGRATTTSVWGVTPNYPAMRTTPVAAGEFFGPDEQASAARVAVLGADVAAALFGTVDPLDATIRVENAPFKVIGVLEVQGASPGGGNLDDRIFIPQATATRRLFNATHLSQVVVQIEGTDQVAPAAQRIAAFLRERHQIPPGSADDFGVRIAEQMLGILTATSRTLTIFLSLVAGLSLLVGGFVVSNIMLISVTERTREIGVRRAVGARRRDIVVQFVLEAALVTMAGGVLGVVVGVTGAFLAARVLGWPAALSWPAIIGAVLFAAIIGLVSGVQPARKAAQLHPVEALRG